MRNLLALLLLLAATPLPARAIPAGFEFVMPATAPTSGRPFLLGVNAIGDWSESGLIAGALANLGRYGREIAIFNISLDGRVIATNALADRTADNNNVNNWSFPRAFRAVVPGLPEGPHEFAVNYAGDSINPPITDTLLFAVQPFQFSLDPIRPPKPLDQLPGADPDGVPAGSVILTDKTTSSVSIVDISTFLVRVSGDLTLDFSRLRADTVITYRGDANFAPFNVTYDAPEPIPAPAAPLALALAALAALRIRRPAAQVVRK